MNHRKALFRLLLGLLITPFFVSSFSAVSSSSSSSAQSESKEPSALTLNKWSGNYNSDTKKNQFVKKFVSLVDESIHEESFGSLLLRGVKANKNNSKKKKKKNISYKHDDSNLRGSIRQVHGRLIQVKQRKLLQLTLKYHGATDICKNVKLEQLEEKLTRLILDPDTASEWGAEAVLLNPIQGAELRTASAVWELKLNNKATPSLNRRRVNTSDSKKAPPPLTHDRPKNVPLPNQANFFQALGVTKSDGKPRPGMTSKLRQCQKFVQIVAAILNNQKGLKAERPISVIDMGCGRGYLTFALHAYLAERYPSVRSIGIDVRPKLVKEISTIASSLGGVFDTLSFEEGTIEDILADATVSSQIQADESPSSFDILIALHACDTATDDALWSGICRQAEVIVVAPCCHKEIRPQLNSHFASSEGKVHPMVDVMKHGVYRERLSETVTDSLRALLLERAGYKVQVFEFIGGEHTSKNVMITAVKNHRHTKDVESIQNRIQSLASFHGIQEQKLSNWMKEDLGGSRDNPPSPRFGIRQMPPLS